MLNISPFQPSDQDAAKALVLIGLAERFNRFKPELNPDRDDIDYDFEVFLVSYLEDTLVDIGLRDWTQAVQIYKRFGFSQQEEFTDETGFRDVRFHKDLHLVS